MWFGDHNIFSKSLWAIVVAVVLFIGGLFAGFPFPTLFLALIFGTYVFLASESIRVALQGNFILLNKIKERELGPKREEKERMLAAARQKASIKKGIQQRLVQYATIFMFALIGLSRLSQGMGQGYPAFERAFQLLIALIVVDVIAAGIILAIARARDDEENVLYSGEISDEAMANILAKGGPNP